MSGDAPPGPLRLDRSLGDADNGGLAPGELPDDLAGVQAGILRSHGRDHGAFALVRWVDGPAARAWLAGLLDGSTLGPPLTDTAQQLAHTAEHRAAADPAAADPAGPVPTRPVVSLWLAPTGCAALGLAPPAHAPFEAGMDARRPILRDPSPDPAGADFSACDAIVSVASDDAAEVDDMAARLAAAPGATVLRVERTAVRRNPAGQRTEPFGFVDGISDPDFWAPTSPESPSSPAAPLGLALVREQPPGSFGSFLVVRKLLQDVDRFAQAAADEAAAARLVGRTRQGAPLVANPNAAAGNGLGDDNDFDYGADPFGRHCPLTSHVRKANPRGGSRFETLADERMHRLVRRGMPLAESPGGPQGLMFIAFQADLGRQFEFVQRVWMTNADFPFAGTGVEGLASFVRLEGGAYLYAPSVPALAAAAADAG